MNALTLSSFEPVLPPQLPPTVTKTIAHESLLGWTRQQDEQFWTDLGGIPGLLGLYRDARKLRAVEPSESNFIASRATAIGCCAFIEAIFRVIGSYQAGLPHLPARMAATLYFEAHLRAENIRLANPTP